MENKKTNTTSGRGVADQKPNLRLFQGACSIVADVLPIKRIVMEQKTFAKPDRGAATCRRRFLPPLHGKGGEGFFGLRSNKKDEYHK